MKEENKPSYYAVIPANVRYSDIPPNAKLLYGEITALCDKTGFCWSTNKYFADLYKKSESTISVWISHLIRCGFIESEIEDNFRRKIFLKGVLEKSKGGIRKTRKGVLEKSKESNTVSITNSITVKRKDRAKKFAPVSDPEKTFEQLTAKAKKITATQSDTMPNGDEELTQLKSEKPKRKKVAPSVKKTTVKELAKAEPKEPSLFTLAKDSFTEWHKKHSPGVELYWDRKEIGQLAQMIKRLQHEAKASNFVARSDQDFIEKIFDPFCKKYINSKEWFSDSFTPASIVSKWNVIVQALRNPKAKNGTKTPERLKMEREYQPSSEIKVSKVPV